MAYASWLVPNKQSGSGNDTVNFSAGSSNTGRTARSTVVTFKAVGCTDVEGYAIVMSNVGWMLM